MSEPPLTKDSLKFFSTHVQSIERLEILCLLVGNPSKSWSAIDIYRQIQSTEKTVTECLQDFVKHNLAIVDANNLFRFPLKSSEVITAAVQLVNAYRQRRVAVIQAIYARPADEPEARHRR